MDFKILEPYAPMFWSDKTYYLISGGRGSGKSTQAAAYFLIKLMGEEYFRGVVSRYTQKSIKSSIYRDILDLADSWNIKKFIKIEGDEMTNVLNGNMVITHAMKLQDGTMTAKGKGLAGVTHLLIDEATELPSEEEFIKLNDSFRAKGTERKVFILFNPTSKRHWIHKRFYIDGRPNPKWFDDHEFIHTTYKDNEENLKPQIINTILHKASKSDNWRRVYLEGKLGRLETLVFPNYEVIDKRPDNRLLKHHTLGLDFGVNDPTTLVLTADYYNERGERLGVYVEELFYKRGLNTIGIIDNIIHATQEWREILLGEREFLIIYADSAGKLTIEDITPTINQYKIKVFAADKSNGSVGRGILHLQSEGIYINRKSLNAIEEFSGYEFIKNRDGNITDCPIDKDNHVIDAVRYSRKDRMQQWAIEHGLKIKEQLEK